MPAPTIYYIRHGETSWNAEGRLQGTLDVPLNELGRKQAVHAGEVLADLFARDGRDKRDLVYCREPAGTCAHDHGLCARSAWSAAGRLRDRRSPARDRLWRMGRFDPGRDE